MTHNCHIVMMFILDSAWVVFLEANPISRKKDCSLESLCSFKKK